MIGLALADRKAAVHIYSCGEQKSRSEHTSDFEVDELWRQKSTSGPSNVSHEHDSEAQ